MNEKSVMLPHVARVDVLLVVDAASMPHLLHTYVS